MEEEVDIGKAECADAENRAGAEEDGGEGADPAAVLVAPSRPSREAAASAWPSRSAEVAACARCISCLTLVRKACVGCPAHSTSRHQPHSAGLGSELDSADEKKRAKNAAYSGEKRGDCGAHGGSSDGEGEDAATEGAASRWRRVVRARG